MIELQDVSYHYQNNSAQGICALDHITCHLDMGRCYCLQGPNGCGKSTLFRILNGLSFPTSGHYIFNGMEITEKAMRKPDFSKDFHKQVGFVFQHSEIQLFCKTVEEEIAFGLQQLRLPDSEIEARVERYIQLLHLENIRQRAPFNLSGGEQKRCALAAVLAMDPKVLESIVSQIPVGRLGKGEEIADMVAFLAGEHAGYVTGSTLSLNGGQYMAG